MIISAIKKDYGYKSTMVLYRQSFSVEPPACPSHAIINCQVCFERGLLAKTNYYDLTDEEKRRYNSNRKTSARRSKTSITDYALCNDFSAFITLTFDQKLNDSFNYDHCKRLVSKWINNQRRTSPKLSYILVAEKHHKGSIHFHMITNNFQGTLTPATNGNSKSKNYGQLIVKNGKHIYNLDGWKYGFSTLSHIVNKEATAYYLQKYLTKDFIEAFNKKRYWCSRNLKRPIKTYNDDPIQELANHPPLFRKLHKTEHLYIYTFYPGAHITRTPEEIRRFARNTARGIVGAH